MFKKFKVGDVLSVETTKYVPAKRNLIDGDIPYITRTVRNNGYTGTCGNIDKLNNGNCITIGDISGIAFYQPDNFVAGDEVHKLSREGLGEKEYLFLASALNIWAGMYSYSRRCTPKRIEAETLNRLTRTMNIRPMILIGNICVTVSQN